MQDKNLDFLGRMSCGHRQVQIFDLVQVVSCCPHGSPSSKQALCQVLYALPSDEIDPLIFSALQYMIRPCPQNLRVQQIADTFTNQVYLAVRSKIFPGPEPKLIVDQNTLAAIRNGFEPCKATKPALIATAMVTEDDDS